MKKTIVSALLIFSFITMVAQDEVTFNFSRKLVSEINFKIKLFVNGVEVAQLKMGENYSYKVLLDVNKPVTVMAKYGGIKQEISFTLSPEKICNLETNFNGSFIYLELVSGGNPLPGSGMVAGFKPKLSDLSLLYTSTRVLPSDTIRLLWLERGGKIQGQSTLGAVNILSMKSEGSKLTGIGGQATFTMTNLKFNVPEYKPGIRTWSSAVYGASMSLQAYSQTISATGMHPMSSFSLNTIYSVNLGYTIGFGKFKGETKWKGVALELDYKPSFTWGFSSESDKIGTSFNFLGAGLDINFNNFTSNAAKLAPRAQSKLTFFMLPSIKGSPLIITAGYGLTIYTKQKTREDYRNAKLR